MSNLVIMSRIGIKPIKIEDGVTVEVSDKTVVVKGQNGELSKQIPRKFWMRENLFSPCSLVSAIISAHTAK